MDGSTGKEAGPRFLAYVNSLEAGDKWSSTKLPGFPLAQAERR